MSAERWEELRLPRGWRLERREEVASSNDAVRELAAGEGVPVLLAERQLAGRGRRGAAWLSRPGASLTFSVLLRPSEPAGLWPRLSLAAGLAVAEACGAWGVEAEIKWPNDVLVDGRKLAGILVEAVPGGAVVGIGINVAEVELPAELEAASLAGCAGREIDRVELLSRVLERLELWSTRIGAGFGDLVRGVRERCFLSGKRVRLRSGEEALGGIVREVGERGELVLDTDAGIRRLLQADEVRVV